MEEFLFYIFVIFCIHCPVCIESHGRLIDPPSRASMWRHGFNLPQNDYDDNQGYCGGQQQLWNRFEGICGVCGDARYPIPRAHERGGRYYAGTIVKNYREGDTIEVTTQITANHKGWFEFRLCAYDDPSPEDLEYDSFGNFVEISNSCLNKHVLEVEGGGTRWFLPPPYKVGVYTIKVKLPPRLSCNNCLFQWKWNVANSWGRNPDGESCIGCGEQEQFYACSDISIIPRSGQRPVFTWTPPQRHPDRNRYTERPRYVTQPPKPPVHRPRPPKPQLPPPIPTQFIPRPLPPMPTQSREFPYFTYSPIYTRPKFPAVPSGRTPSPPLYTPITPHFPDWIPTHKPTWPWFTVEPQNEKKSQKLTTSTAKWPMFTLKPTTSQTISGSFKFWDWLSDRFSPKKLTTKSPLTTTDAPDTPWWAKLASSNKVNKWWNFISKINLKSRGTTTSVPLPWWVKKTTPEVTPRFLNERGESVDGEKELNSISAAASKDAHKIETKEQIMLEEEKEPEIKRKRICTPVGSLIQKADMWLWCDVNCSKNEYCPKTHCICTSN